jgi:glutamate synthase domain-containing protein 3
MQTTQTEDLAQLGHLIEELSNETEAQCELLREHLESARISLVGAMPAEYALSMQLAREAANCITDHDLRRRIEKFAERAVG